jgi:hypothetical protein
VVSKGTLVQQTVNIVPGVPCTIEH